MDESDPPELNDCVLCGPQKVAHHRPQLVWDILPRRTLYRVVCGSNCGQYTATYSDPHKTVRVWNEKNPMNSEVGGSRNGITEVPDSDV